ncbi:hypothetical protein [Paenibacillus sp. 2TAB19]|uniref:hypothetical protein n=1 Tax=Paenibacillus sp. 2TAB19 TaxID=3233003 RepID=UPI003F9564C8
MEMAEVIELWERLQGLDNHDRSRVMANIYGGYKAAIQYNLSPELEKEALAFFARVNEAIENVTK